MQGYSTAATQKGGCPCCTTDPVRRAALDRLRVQVQHLRVCAASHALMPLDRYYRRPLRLVPLAEVLGRCA
jgi:hypothetical protein